MKLQCTRVPPHNFNTIACSLNARRARTVVTACKNNDDKQETTRSEHYVGDRCKMAATAAALAITLFAPLQPFPAHAVLNSPTARLPRTPEAALRRSIPAFNQDVKSIQQELESIQFKLRLPQRKPWAAMQSDLSGAISLARDENSMLRGILPNDNDTARLLLKDIQSDLDRLAMAIELKDADRTSIRVANALERVASLELLQAPNLPYPIPFQYQSLPKLTGRAIVELVIEKGGSKKTFIDPDSQEGPTSKTTLQLTVDGYSAPLTAGNFIKNVLDGVYDGQKLIVTADSIQMGNQGKNIGALPLEILASGEFEPLYRLPLDVRSGEMPVLPLSIYGSAAMTHLPNADASVGFVSSRQFFIYKYERKSSGLAGLSFDEGTFGVFGYITKGTDQISRIEDGDVLLNARLVAGRDKLVGL